jgi:hypothetical protein
VPTTPWIVLRVVAAGIAVRADVRCDLVEQNRSVFGPESRFCFRVKAEALRPATSARPSEMRSACDRHVGRQAPVGARYRASGRRKRDVTGRAGICESSLLPGLSRLLAEGEGFEPSMDEKTPITVFETSTWSISPSSLPVDGVTDPVRGVGRGLGNATLSDVVGLPTRRRSA